MGLLRPYLGDASWDKDDQKQPSGSNTSVCESGACCTVFRAECTAPSPQGILSFLFPRHTSFRPYWCISSNYTLPSTVSLPCHYPLHYCFLFTPLRNFPSHLFRLSFKYCHICFRQYGNTNLEPALTSICLCASQEGVGGIRGIAPFIRNLSTGQRRVGSLRPRLLCTVSSLSRCAPNTCTCALCSLSDLVSQIEVILAELDMCFTSSRLIYRHSNLWWKYPHIISTSDDFRLYLCVCPALLRCGKCIWFVGTLENADQFMGYIYLCYIEHQNV
jgi:hypothetical protein